MTELEFLLKRAELIKERLNTVEKDHPKIAKSFDFKATKEDIELLYNEVQHRLQLYNKLINRIKKQEKEKSEYESFVNSAHEFMRDEY